MAPHAGSMLRPRSLTGSLAGSITDSDSTREPTPATANPNLASAGAVSAAATISAPAPISASADYSSAQRLPHHKVSAFVAKLYAMLQDPKLSHLIWWSRLDDGDSSTFALLPGSAFARSLTSYFKHGNVASFVRQLHMYGFHKVCDSTPPPAPPQESDTEEAADGNDADEKDARAKTADGNDAGTENADADETAAAAGKKADEAAPGKAGADSASNSASPEMKPVDHPVWEFRHSTSKFHKDGEDDLYLIRRRQTSSRSASTVAHAAHGAAASLVAAQAASAMGLPAGIPAGIPAPGPYYAAAPAPYAPAPYAPYPTSMPQQAAMTVDSGPQAAAVPGDNASFSFRPLNRHRYPSVIVDPYAAPPVPPVTFSPAQAAALAVPYYAPRHSLSELQVGNNPYYQYDPAAYYNAAVAGRSASYAAGGAAYRQHVSIRAGPAPTTHSAVQLQPVARSRVETLRASSSASMSSLGSNRDSSVFSNTTLSMSSTSSSIAAPGKASINSLLNKELRKVPKVKVESVGAARDDARAGAESTVKDNAVDK